MPVVLVVDDEWMNREMLQAYLETSGYEVVLAHSGEKALELIAARLPDLVLTDVRMPGMSGYELCARLKANPATQFIPVLLVTGLERDEDRQRGIDAGADDFVSKPLDAPVMLNRIKGLLRIKSLHAALEAQNSLVRRILARHLDANMVEIIMADLAQAQANCS